MTCHFPVSLVKTDNKYCEKIRAKKRFWQNNNKLNEPLRGETNLRNSGGIVGTLTLLLDISGSKTNIFILTSLSVGYLGYDKLDAAILGLQ